MTPEQLTHQYVFSLRDGRWPRRFPALSNLTVRRVAFAEDLAFISYDVYLEYRRRATIIDQLSFSSGKIVHILSIAADWPAS